jgi:DNA-binding phage protein
VSALDRVIEEGDRREPGFAAAVEAELTEIRAFDDVVNVVLDRLGELGWTREELAARADLNAASLRRLLTASSANPTFATMMSIAEALGLRIEIREQVSVEQMLTAS